MSLEKNTVDINVDFQQAKAKHLQFKSRLRSLLYDEKVEDESPLLYHYQCPVGLWLYGKALKNYSSIPEIHELEKVHTEIHSRGRELIELYKSGEKEQSRRGLASVEKVADKLIDLLTIVEKKVSRKTVPEIFEKNNEEELSLLKDLLQKNEILDKKIRENTGNILSDHHVLKEFFLQSPGIVCILRGENHVYELANEAYLELIGDRPVIGLSIREALPELQEQGFFELLDNVYRTQLPFKGSEVRVVLEKKEGITETAYINFVYQPILNSQKKSIGIIVSGNDVTEQVLAKNKIEEFEERARVSIEAGQMGTVDIDIETQALFASSKFNQIFGFEKTMPYETYVALVHPDDAEHRRTSHEEGRIKGHLNYEFRIIRHGEVRWIHFQGKVFTDDDNKPLRILGNAKDITEAKKFEEILKRFQYMADSANDLFLLIRKNGSIVYMNTIAKNILGYGEDEISILNIKDIDPDYYSQSFNTNAAGNHEHSVPFIESKYYKKDGSFFPVEIVANLIDFTEEPLMFAVVRNISERNKIESALESSEEKFRLLADNSPQNIWTSDESGNLNYYNKYVFDYTGLSRADIDKYGWLDIVHPDDREANVRVWTHAIKTGTPFLFEHRFRRHDGEFRWQLSRALPQKDAEGNIVRWIGTSTDIHDRKIFTDQLENLVQIRTRELKNTNEELMRSNDELAQFAYIASHDLQEPLRKIQAFASRINDSTESKISEKDADYFLRIRSAAERMQHLIRDILSFSRVNSGEKQFELTDLNMLLQKVLSNLKHDIDEKKGVINATALPSLKIIPYQFEQLLTNFIMNSLKFSKTGIVPEINISCDVVNGKTIDHENVDRIENYYKISVTDNGIGFDEQYKEKIFQVFQRLHRHLSYPGTGIGLAICKKIVENHKGVITCESKVDFFSRFNIYLPV